jgi:hypothetical protein
MPGCLETQDGTDKIDTETVRKRSKNYGKKNHQVTVNGVLDIVILFFRKDHD